MYLTPYLTAICLPAVDLISLLRTWSALLATRMTTCNVMSRVTCHYQVQCHVCLHLVPDVPGVAEVDEDVLRQLEALHVIHGHHHEDGGGAAERYPWVLQIL